MMAEAEPLVLVGASARAERALVRVMGAHVLRVGIPLCLDDGSIVWFYLVVHDTGTQLVVRELPQRHLPAFCPERHINGDGSFCLGLPGVDLLRPTTYEQVLLWWKLLRGFLRCQVDADLIGEWTAPTSWSHGAAAFYQRAIELAEQEYPRVVKAARRVFAGETPGLPDDAPCPCGSDATLDHCHAPLYRDALGMLALEREIAAQYWTTLPIDAVCCGTMKTCGLSKTR